jgi:hypothetical protein
LGLRRFDADYEANQISLFKKSAPAIMQNFLLRAELELSSLLVLINKNYKGFEAPMAQGFGGMADATGVSTSFAFAAAKAQGKQVDLEADLPPTAAITDFMAVWDRGNVWFIGRRIKPGWWMEADNGTEIFPFPSSGTSPPS